MDLDADESEAGGLSSRGTSDAHAESEDDEPLDNQPLGVVVNPAMLLEQQEEIARLRDMLDEESHRRATLEQKVQGTLQSRPATDFGRPPATPTTDPGTTTCALSCLLTGHPFV